VIDAETLAAVHNAERAVAAVLPLVEGWDLGWMPVLGWAWVSVCADTQEYGYPDLSAASGLQKPLRGNADARRSSGCYCAVAGEPVSRYRARRSLLRLGRERRAVALALRYA
jgi:hypothetical protein